MGADGKLMPNSLARSGTPFSVPRPPDTPPEWFFQARYTYQGNCTGVAFSSRTCGLLYLVNVYYAIARTVPQCHASTGCIDTVACGYNLNSAWPEYARSAQLHISYLRCVELCSDDQHADTRSCSILHENHGLLPESPVANGSAFSVQSDPAETKVVTK